MRRVRFVVVDGLGRTVEAVAVSSDGCTPHLELERGVREVLSVTIEKDETPAQHEAGRGSSAPGEGARS